MCSRRFGCRLGLARLGSAWQVKKFLMDAKLPDPRPLIHVCDRHDFIEEMTGYLYKSSLQKYIEVRFLSRVLRLLRSEVVRPPRAGDGVLEYLVPGTRLNLFQNCSLSFWGQRTQKFR